MFDSKFVREELAFPSLQMQRDEFRFDIVVFVEFVALQFHSVYVLTKAHTTRYSNFCGRDIKFASCIILGSSHVNAAIVEDLDLILENNQI